MVKRGPYWEGWRANEKPALEYEDCNYVAEFIDLLHEVIDLSKQYPKIYSVGKRKKFEKLLDKARMRNKELREKANALNKKMKNKKKNKGKYGYK